jgi:hypothetical protein
MSARSIDVAAVMSASYREYVRQQQNLARFLVRGLLRQSSLRHGLQSGATCESPLSLWSEVQNEVMIRTRPHHFCSSMTRTLHSLS